MARDTLTPLAAPGGYASAGAALTFAPVVVANGAQFPMRGNDLVLVQNTGATSHTVTFTSVADLPFGRLGNITAEAIAAGVTKVFGPFPTAGWMQTNGMMYIDANDPEVTVAVIRL